MNKINWKFDNSYSRLSGSFKENINPIPVKNPEIILLNSELESELNLNLSDIKKKRFS